MNKVFCILCAFALAPSVQAQQLDPGNIAQSQFAQVDADSNGRLDMAEQERFDSDMMISMDLDESGAADMDEFLAWGFGFSAVAEERGREANYQTASRIIFSIMDYDDSGEVTLEEMNGFQAAAFAYSDQDDDGELTPEEFHSHHFMNIAAQEALMPIQ
ncbi:hypothetical protein [Paracoccus aerodenitrificans]|uniref:hypothetical protein n=1 Tax=Paracoccus aerodenitrificans TaxID=3017781 RepID=UPI0022F11F3D|nr:hypothetical protein [Paracoccus aerodenitrificans]WBU64158.1 hypothetical protein PAE61_01505 [Paracoccus aerodenitrificans]